MSYLSFPRCLREGAHRSPKTTYDITLDSQRNCRREGDGGVGVGNLRDLLCYVSCLGRLGWREDCWGFHCISLATLHSFTYSPDAYFFVFFIIIPRLSTFPSPLAFIGTRLSIPRNLINSQGQWKGKTSRRMDSWKKKPKAKGEKEDSTRGRTLTGPGL